MHKWWRWTNSCTQRISLCVFIYMYTVYACLINMQNLKRNMLIHFISIPVYFLHFTTSCVKRILRNASRHFRLHMTCIIFDLVYSSTLYYIRPCITFYLVLCLTLYLLWHVVIFVLVQYKVKWNPRSKTIQGQIHLILYLTMFYIWPRITFDLVLCLTLYLAIQGQRRYKDKYTLYDIELVYSLTFDLQWRSRRRQGIQPSTSSPHHRREDCCR